MSYYELIIIGLEVKTLTYHSNLRLEKNDIVEVLVLGRKREAIVVKKTQKPPFDTIEILAKSPFFYTDYQLNLAKFISYYYVCSLGIAYGLLVPTKKLPPILKKDDIKKPTLSPLQQRAKDFCNKNRASLLFGDTGSGKSEVYISLIADVLESGSQALFLMPEISLTPQMQKRLKNYFGKRVAIWHSKITKAKKSSILEGFESGEISLIAGARSALFLPFSNISLIIVDEEHDDSYKSSQNPRYNAKDLALFISQKADIPAVLGSATPLLTTIYKQPTFRMKGTYFESKKEFIYDECEPTISPLIKKELEICFSKGHQAIVFIPTRANFKYLYCKECKTIVKCPFCSVGMSLHSDKNLLKCHYCGYSCYKEVKCSKCGSTTLESKKIGTNEALSILQRAFPTKNIAKFDKDAITTQKKLEKTLREFNDKKIDLLVGTQMLSKGHDYHNVKLAIIIGLDEHLGYADFRAREKALSTAMQLAGRAGRVGDGKVIIQTLHKEFFSLYIQNYDAFLKDELPFRVGLYPPFKRLLRILISNKNDKKAQAIQNEVIERIKFLKDIEIIGYGKALIEYIASKFRYEILVRSNSYQELIKAANLAKMPDVQIEMDAINFS